MLSHWRVVSLKTIGYKIGFGRNCLARSTAYLFVFNVHSIIKPIFKIENFEEKIFPKEKIYSRRSMWQRLTKRSSQSPLNSLVNIFSRQRESQIKNLQNSDHSTHKRVKNLLPVPHRSAFFKHWYISQITKRFAFKNSEKFQNLKKSKF